MMLQSFAISNTRFEIDALNLPDDFTVKSIVDDYRVVWHDSRSPLEQVRALLTTPETLLIIDQNVLKHFGQNIDLDYSKIHAVSAIEQAKTLEGVTGFFDFLILNNANKYTRIVAVGGGIVQEIAAFACLCYKRGMKWVLIPTTLLAMSDSCIGGKASLNYKNVKNQLGLFSPPSEVFINVGFLQTLSLQDLKSGLGEILKVCLIAGEDVLNVYKVYIADALKKEPSALKKLIFLSLMIKRAIIEVDEFDRYERRALNYGHTIGHILESLTNFQLPHGLAIAAGIVFANRISVEYGLLSDSKVCELEKLCFDLLDDQALENIALLEAEKIFDLLKSDKKTDNEMLQFVLLENPSVVHLLKINLKSDKDKILKAISTALRILAPA